MLLSWSLPRFFVATPVWRVRTDFSLAPAKPRPVQRPKAKDVARAAPAALDRSSARALVDAGYMPLSRYVELFEGAEPHFGEGEV